MLSSDTYLQNRFRIICPLGKGGMGRVYAAKDEALGCTVAIKQTFAGTDELQRAFKREARLLANLRHSALPRVTHHFIEGDEQFLVMDYVEGDNLEVILKKRQRPFSYIEILPIADKLLDALEYLHRFKEPIIHRDIKPANIKLTSNGDIFLLDFGLAKGVVGDLTTKATENLSVYGYTPNYAPMEQVSSSGTNAQSDLFSLGATLYHLLTDSVPISAGDRYVHLDQETTDPLLPPHQLNPKIPLTLSKILSQAMEMSRKNRFSSATEMRRALREVTALHETSNAVLAPVTEVLSNDLEKSIQTEAFSVQPFQINLETVPLTKPQFEPQPTEDIQPILASSIRAEPDNSWASLIDSSGNETADGKRSLTSRLRETMVMPQFLRFADTGESPDLVSKSKPAYMIFVSVVVLITILTTAYLLLSGSGETPPVVSTQSQINQELAKLTSEATKAANVGNTLIQQNKITESDAQLSYAEELFQRAVMIEPNNAKLHVSLASVFIYREKWTEATAEYQEAVRLEPNNDEYKNNLVALQARKNKR